MERRVQLVIALIIGISIGILATLNLTLQYDCQILYVAQDELMELESKRIKKLGEEQLFYGEINKAVELAAKIPESYRNSNTKVLYSIGAISGEGAKSISKEVHRRIIGELNNKNERE